MTADHFAHYRVLKEDEIGGRLPSTCGVNAWLVLTCTVDSGSSKSLLRGEIVPVKRRDATAKWRAGPSEACFRCARSRPDARASGRLRAHRKQASEGPARHLAVASRRLTGTISPRKRLLDDPLSTVQVNTSQAFTPHVDGKRPPISSSFSTR